MINGHDDVPRGAGSVGPVQPVSEPLRSDLLKVVRSQAFRDMVDGGIDPAAMATATRRGSPQKSMMILLLLLIASTIGWPLYLHQQEAAIHAEAEAAAHQNLLDERDEMLELVASQLEYVENRRQSLQDQYKYFYDNLEFAMKRYLFLAETDRTDELAIELYKLSLAAKAGETFHEYVDRYVEEIDRVLRSIAPVDESPN